MPSTDPASSSRPAAIPPGPGTASESAAPYASASTSPRLGVRSTRQREAIAELLDRQQVFISAQDVHAELRAAGQRIGLTTVYRTLQSMVDLGAVDTLRNDAGEQLFRRCSDHHHHHLVCRGCGRTVEVQADTVERWTRSVAAANGFSEVQHTIELVGLCADCATRGEPGQGEPGRAT